MVASTGMTLKVGVLACVGSALAKHGFSPKARGQSFHRRTSYGRTSVHLSFIQHADAIDVTVDVAVRVDAVEELVNSVYGRLSDREKLATSTVGGELGVLTDGRQRRWTMQSADDIPAVCDGVIKSVELVGLPYLDRMSDSRVLLDTLSSSDPQDWIHAPFHGGRCLRAVAAAHLFAPSRVQQVMEVCLAILERFRDPAIVALRRLGGGRELRDMSTD